MNWSYVAGAFDMDGSCYFVKANKVYELAFCNDHKLILERIRKFIDAGRMVQKAGNQWQLVISRKRSFIRVASMLFLLCTVKKDALWLGLMYMENRKWKQSRLLTDTACKVFNHLQEAQKHLNKNYKIGRDFEYRVKALLKRHGWHSMRRYGSWGEKPKGIGKVSTDLTAFRHGIYLIITCKYSTRYPTTYLDDEYWENLVDYARTFGAIPIFAGVNTKRKTYFVDLRTGKEFNIKEEYATVKMDVTSLATYRSKLPKKMSEEDVGKLIQELWNTIDFCNEVLETKSDDIETLKVQARFLNVKSTAINSLNRLLYQSGETVKKDELTSRIEKVIEEEAKELGIKKD